MKYFLLLCVLIACPSHILWSQDKPKEEIANIKFDSLDDPAFKQILGDKMKNTQFILLGEQHGIREIGSLAKHIYSLAHLLGFNTYCIETDALIAEKISSMANHQDPVSQAKMLKEEFPFSIPFYENPNDYELFKQVKQDGGDIWGIDQVFMAEWRLYFHTLSERGSNRELRDKSLYMKEIAMSGFKESIEKKQFQSMGMFQFQPSDYTALTDVSTDAGEKKMIELLARSHAIYMDNTEGRYYQNNYRRSQLMKENFMYEHRNSQTKNPKVMFRMGAYHMGRGLTETRVYDIGNMASELAESMGRESLHIMALGIKGEKTVGNPFSPISHAPYDNQKELVPELVNIAEEMTEKYLLIDTVPLRNKAKSFSTALQKYLFRYDLLIFINDTHAYDELGE